MHWGGGTPTFLTDEEITRLICSLKQHFNFADNAELSIEINPREITPKTINHLANVGFNRLSMGIQDFNHKIQNLINPKQDENLICSLINQARKNNFQSINLDLIYGLPKQTVASFTEILNKVIDILPDDLVYSIMRTYLVVLLHNIKSKIMIYPMLIRSYKFYKLLSRN